MTQSANLLRLNSLGQSIWYDNLSLDVLQSGELKGLVQRGVTGLTSNPTIFKKAIADTDHYDQKIQEFAKEGLGAEEITERLMVRDVGAAADLLLETYNSTNMQDGYASIEVSPTLAHDLEGTVSAAKRLWKSLDRPNVMIKIPATEVGVSAIEEVLKHGINVNVTLIFSVDVYKKVVGAYLNALRAPHDGVDITKISSVASFFVSRVDAAIEKSLDEGALTSFLGKVGVANSKAAYEHFLDVFYGEAFSDLQNAGAMVQRPLWASTGVKNPTFDELLYVEQLAGKDTVNTLPPKTLMALIDREQFLSSDNLSEAGPLHGEFSEAQEVLSKLSGAGVDLSDILLSLQKGGVSSFADSYTELISAVEEKQGRIAA